LPLLLPVFPLGQVDNIVEKILQMYTKGLPSEENVKSSFERLNTLVPQSLYLKKK
jgi:hypothetical protein